MAIETPEATPLPHAASKITSGVFGIPRGGTNLSTIAAGGILYASALDTLIRIAPTSANQVLRSTGANVLQIASLIAGDIPALDAAKITTGIFVLARIPNMDWAHISGLFPRTIADLLSNHDLARHPLSIIPTMDNGHIPNLETLGYGGAFAAAQIPSLDASKITTGVLGLARIPTMDDTHIPNIETLSYGGVFANAQIPSLTSKLFSLCLIKDEDATPIDNALLRVINGVLQIRNSANSAFRELSLSSIPTMDTAHIPNLSANKITSDVLALARIPTMDDGHIPNIETLSYGGRFAVAQIPWSSGIDQNLLPDAPSTRQVGTVGTPFAKVYADELHGTAYYADIIFKEKTCKVCGKEFVVGDDLVLKVIEIEEKGIHAVPMHKKCFGEKK